MNIFGFRRVVVTHRNYHRAQLQPIWRFFCFGTNKSRARIKRDNLIMKKMVCFEREAIHTVSGAQTTNSFTHFEANKKICYLSNYEYLLIGAVFSPY